jgi:class 3 adenylate cyclase/tetratricopeptide (TPR) repeat protein
MASETVTILFTDLVKSTELLSREGEERAEEIRRELFELMRGAIAASGGHEVKNVGDGLMVAFEGVIAGLSCAVAIQRAMHTRNRRADQPLALRVALSSGEADVEENDYFGVPVIEAARLVAIAEGDEILTTEIVRLLAGTRGDFEFVARGPMVLKGLDAPVLVHEVRWAPRVADASVPLPARLARGEGSVFVGRVAQQARLDEALKHADVTAEQQVLLISGEAGIGKTTLVSKFADDAFTGGAIVLYGRCDEDLSIPYQPWVEALTHLVDYAPDDLLAEHVAERGADLLTLVPTLRRRVPSVPPARASDPETERHLMFGAVVDLLSRASATPSLVLVLDDLHWADRTTLQLLRHVAAASVPLRLLVLGTFRDTDLGANHPLAELLAALHREPSVERLALGGFDDLELLELMETAAGRVMSEDGMVLRDELLEETDGNPFFVVEILRHLAETGAITQEFGDWTVPNTLRTTGLPVSVREVVGRRVERLGDDAAKTLATAAVIGRDFDLQLLARVVDVDEERLLDVLDEALQAFIIAEAPGAQERYTFVHALIQRTLYDDLSTARRRRLHRRIASALEELPGSRTDRVRELARHWYEATQPEDTPRAYEYAVAAGDDAQAHLAPDEAVRWFAQALELVDRVDEGQAARTRTLIKLGVAQRLSGASEFRETLLDAARLAEAIDETDLLVAATLANSRGFQSNTGQVDEDRVRMLHAALDAIGDSAPTQRARLLALLATESHFAPGVDVQALLDEALALTADAGDVPARLFVMRAVQVHFVPHNLELRRRLSDEEQQINAAADPAQRAWAESARAQVAYQSGADAAALQAQHERWCRAAQRAGDPAIQWATKFGDVMVATMWRDLADAERLLDESGRYGTDTGQPDAVAVYAGQLMAIRSMQGRGDEIVDLVGEVAAASPNVPAFRAGLAALYADSGRFDEVKEILDDFCAAGVDQVHVNIGWGNFVSAVMDAAGVVGHREVAAQVAPLVAPFRDQVAFSGITIDAPFALTIATCARLLERYDEAEAALEDALRVSERIGSKYWIAMTKLEWARLARARRDANDRAGRLLDEALGIARERGYGVVDARAASLLNP